MQKTHMTVAKAVLSAIMLIASFGLAHADEVSDSIDGALQQYKNGEYSAAAGSLDYASQLIRQKKGEQLQSFLPKALTGWTAKDSSSQAIGAGMFGGGVSAERQYHKDSSSVTVTIATDSPLLQTMMMMFNNPMFIASEGGKLEKIGGRKAVVKYNPSDKEGEINIVVANRFLVTVKGEKVSQKDLTDYAMGINYKKLAALP